MVCLQFCQHSDVTFLKEFQQCLNSRYLASTFFSLYTLQHRSTFIPFSVSLRNVLADPVLDGESCLVSRVAPILSFWPKLLLALFVFFCFPIVYFFSTGWYCGAGGLWTDMVSFTLSQDCIAYLLIIIIIILIVLKLLTND